MVSALQISVLWYFCIRLSWNEKVALLRKSSPKTSRLHCLFIVCTIAACCDLVLHDTEGKVT